MTSLIQAYDSFSQFGRINKKIPDFVTLNVNPQFQLREYQKEAIARFIDYLEKYPQRPKPSQLLFHMATGSGKTLLMASNILYLYSKGYRNFLIFVNSKNIIEKTRDNFLNQNSTKYLFNQKIKFEDKDVFIKEIDTFEVSNKDDINIVFTTIQGLHNLMSLPRENCLTFEDFNERKIVLISDEAHHINVWTKKNLPKEEEIAKTTWEHTVNNILNANPNNIMLEYTATVDLNNLSIKDKYQDKIIFDYTLKQFRQDRFSKEVKVLQSDLLPLDRALQAVILSQFRRKIAEKHKIHLKPIVLMKSKTILESENFEDNFSQKIKNLAVADIVQVRSNSKGTILEKIFDYFQNENISIESLVTELKEDFSEEKCISVNSQNESEEKQLLVNTLEDINNEVRCIFAVDKLNEGWDVLNLFDIVRLYDTRDSKGNLPGKTTIAEAQLIGRGARYFPFGTKDNKFTRKFDEEPHNQLKIIEELHYHSTHNPKYIQELTTALKNTGIIPDPLTTYHLKIKDSIKTTSFWSHGMIFRNKKEDADRSMIKNIDDLNLKLAPYNLRTGISEEVAVFTEESKADERITRIFDLRSFGETILRKALSRLEFYNFDNLKKYFPRLNSINELIESLKNIRMEIRSSKERLMKLQADDRLEAAINVLIQFERQIRDGYTDYRGTQLFIPSRVDEIVKEKILKFYVGDYSDKEFGTPMSRPRNESLRLDLSTKEWYIYDENYGTSEEKHFIQFINGMMETLRKRYVEVFLLRNEKLFQLYRFSDGSPIEPDFVLFLKGNTDGRIYQYQIFIETKGEFLVENDSWKQDFLKEIEENFKIEYLFENEDYKLVGLPFFIENSKAEFIEAFNDKLGVSI